MSRIFVFGSNLAGRHGAGSALHAREHFGAQLGVGEGPTGQAYAIPTKDADLQVIPLPEIRKSVRRFLTYAIKNPALEFEVVKIGCGLAGYHEADIAPMFAGAPQNVILPPRWRDRSTVLGRLLVCGGRDYNDRDRVFAALDKVDSKRKVMLVIHGAATGADTLADEWAQARGISRMPFPVTQDDWKAYGRAAGPMRNAEIMRIAQPEACVAFPGGDGTADMTRRCELDGVPVWRPYG
jgi:hypothetical protein